MVREGCDCEVKRGINNKEKEAYVVDLEEGKPEGKAVRLDVGWKM